MNDMITVENLTKVYRSFKGAKEVHALQGVNLTVAEGEFIGIMGPSGSGKTTLLNILSGLDTATSGQVMIEGKPIAKLKKDELALFRRQRIGYIFQDFNLLESLTLKENIALPLILDKIAPPQIEKRVHELMTFFGIGDLAEKYPYHAPAVKNSASPLRGPLSPIRRSALPTNPPAISIRNRRPILWK